MSRIALHCILLYFMNINFHGAERLFSYMVYKLNTVHMKCKPDPLITVHIAYRFNFMVD